MGRLGTFVTGMICGAGLLWGMLHYHVVRSPEGFYFVPKISKSLSEPYVDIRGFELSDWKQHRSLAAAIVQNNQAELLGDSSLNTFRSQLRSAVDLLLGSPPSSSPAAGGGDPSFDFFETGASTPLQ